MVLTFDTRLKAIDKATLTPLVESALGSEPIDIMDWRYQPIHGGAGDLGSDMPGVGGIARFAGNACVQRNIVPWSLILKVLPPRAPGNYTSIDQEYWTLCRETLLHHAVSAVWWTRAMRCAYGWKMSVMNWIR